ncbi:MAG: hypothetical protein OHK0022_37360 [Roseiflexaceae bacterium]
MRKLFICLANSKKYSGRCIAGVEINRTVWGYAIVCEGTKPLWVRPVSGQEHGQVEGGLVERLRLLDVVEVETVAAAPQGCQTENYTFIPASLRVVDHIRHPHLLQEAAYTGRYLFDNTGKAVPADQVQFLDHSLLLIQPQELSIHTATTARGEEQLRAVFGFAGRAHDLPITDLGFIERYHQQGCPPFRPGRTFLTISLGLEHQGWHYKLVAGVIGL